MSIAHVGLWYLLLSILPVLFTAYSYSCLAESRFFTRGSCLVAVMHMQLASPTGNKSNSSSSSSSLDLQMSV